MDGEVVERGGGEVVERWREVERRWRGGEVMRGGEVEREVDGEVVEKWRSGWRGDERWRSR